jgi:hypothetical protein
MIMAAGRRFLTLIVQTLVAAGFAVLPLRSVQAAESVVPSQAVTSLLASADFSVRLIANIAVILTCSLIIIGGLWVFHRRETAAQDLWGPVSVQTLGTIFFFPTLILLAVYLELPKDAITTILGAFLGYMFGRSGGGSSASGQAGDIPLTSQGGPRLRPASAADLREPEDKLPGTPARVTPEQSQSTSVQSPPERKEAA